MANDALKAEIPEALRELMKMSIEQARRAFETFVSTSEKTWKSLEASSRSGRGQLYALNAKIAEITRPAKQLFRSILLGDEGVDGEIVEQLGKRGISVPDRAVRRVLSSKNLRESGGRRVRPRLDRYLLSSLRQARSSWF